MKKAIIFDVDGTLADTERDGHRPAFNEAFKQEGLAWNWDVDLYGKLLKVAGGKERIMHYINDYLPENNRPENPLELAKKLHKIKTDIYVKSLMGGKIPLRKGVKRLILEAKEAGLKLAIATTTSPENISALLDGTLGQGSMGWFDAIGDGENSPIKKPDPQVYHYVLDKLNLKPEECLAIEDTEIGLQAAGAAGLDVVITINDYTAAQDFTGARLVLSDMGEAGEPCQIIAGDCQMKFLSVKTLTDCF